MALIKITPDELRDAAKFLDSKREEINNSVTALQNKINATTAEWEGAAQSSFIESFNDMLPLLNEKFPEVIVGISSQLNGAANALEATDADIASSFKG